MERPGTFNIVKVSVLPKASHRFSGISKYQCTLYRNRTKNPLICMETQKTLHAQNNLEKEEHDWRHHISWFQNIWQSYSNWNSKVLT